jgi:hypothetical protein
MERYTTVKPTIQERILIRKLDPPSHAGEVEFGFCLVFDGRIWQFELAWNAASNASPSSGFDYIDIPASVWVKPPYEALRELVRGECSLDTYLKSRKDCVEWEKLERLFDEKRRG